ncbi:MAG: alpha/beta hydrolase, partial [Nannocystaceae bacterium]
HERMEIEGGGGGGQADETANERAVAALVKAGIRSTRYPLDGDVEMHTLAVDGDPNVPWVLVPGLGNPASAWGGLLKAIKFQHTALAVDPVGFGLSTGPEAPTYVDHAEHLRQLLQVRFSGQRVLLVASSMGGLAALELARRSPQTVAGLVLIGFGLVDDPAAWRAELDRLWARPEEFMSLAFKVPPRPSELYREQFEAARGRPAFRSYYAANDLGPTAIAGLEVPVLMIGGFDDQIVEIEVMRATAQLVPGELVEVARAGHFPERERPEEVVRGIEGFLRGKGLFG